MDRAPAKPQLVHVASNRRHGPVLEPGFHADCHEGQMPPASEMDPAIAMHSLDYAYDEGGRPHQVLFGLDLEIHAGEVVLLTGPSGCGKTTLLTLIGGLRSVESGELTVLGHELHACQPAELVQVRRSIGFIFQLHNLLDFLTARQNVQMALELHPEFSSRAMEDRAAEMLNQVGLARYVDAFPAHLSGGQKQRVSIAACPRQPPQTHPGRRANIGARQPDRPRSGRNPLAPGPRGRLHNPDGHPRYQNRRRRRPSDRHGRRPNRLKMRTA